MLLALRPLYRPAPLGTASWALGSIVNESPFVAFYWVLAATLLALAQGDLGTPVGWVAVGIACVTFLGTPVLVRRSLAARPAVEEALDDGLGHGWRDAIDPTLSARFRRSLPWARILLAPIPVLHRDVKRARNLSYGDAGRRNRLDVYHHPERPAGAPILVHLHGGGFHMGRKSLYSRALLVELARHGWVCISANYRLRPRAVFPDYVVDAKKVVAWARRHGRGVRRRPVCRLRRGELGRRSHRGHGCADTERRRLPARVRGSRHHGRRRDLPVRLLRPGRPRPAAAPLVAVRLRPARRAARLRRARRARRARPGLAGPGAGRPAPRGLDEPGCVRRASRRASQLRPVPLDPLRDPDRRDRGLHRLGPVTGRAPGL